MDIVFGVAGSVLMYELCKVHKILVGHEKCAKSMEKMYSTIKQCPQCSLALNELSENYNQMNDFNPIANSSMNNSSSIPPNSTATFNDCEPENNTNTVYNTATSGAVKNSNHTDHFDSHSNSTSNNTGDNSTSVAAKGKITRNPFLNYCREIRVKRLGLQQSVIVKESACKWKQLTEADKMNYTFCAVHIRERTLAKDQKIHSRSLNQNKTN
ncbi:unnamed protein product [Diamesa serratosioi]